MIVSAVNLITQIIIETNEQAETLAEESKANNQMLQKMIEELFGISKVVKTNTSELNGAVEQFNATTKEATSSIEKMANGATETAKEIEKETILIDSIKQKISEVSHAVHKASESSNQVESAIIERLDIVGNLQDKSQTITIMNTEVNQSMKELLAKSANITHITNIISEIAEQTNLLALNAAIEAARVGEQGKGFAVVAEFDTV